MHSPSLFPLTPALYLSPRCRAVAAGRERENHLLLLERSERYTVSDESSKLSSSPGPRSAEVPPRIPDHELLQCIGEGSYGQVWLARNVMGEPRAVKVVDRRKFRDDETAYEREFKGIRLYEPISRSHESLVQILHVGRDDEAGCFYYVMELADAV